MRTKQKPSESERPTRSRWLLVLLSAMAVVGATAAAGSMGAPETQALAPAAVLPPGSMTHDRISIQTGNGGQNTGWIDVESWSWGETQTGGVAGGGGAGKVSMQDFHFTKFLDKNSPQLALFCAEGRHLPKATFEDFTTDNNGKDVKYLTIVLEDVMITSYQIGGSGNDQLPMEEIAMSFAKITFVYGGDNPTPGNQFTWDLVENRGG